MLTLKSSAFTHKGAIPREYTCDDADVAPQLEWSDPPEGTKSFALIVDDPDAPDPKAPKMVYVHWVLYDIPVAITSMARGGQTPPGARDGRNDWKRTGYGGPCPPVGRHRYFFRLFALDAMLGDLKSPTKADLLKAMEGRILAQAELMGTYERARQVSGTT